MHRGCPGDRKASSSVVGRSTGASAHLVVHGVLHLLGFDHGDDAEAERMEDVERTALASLGVADPYAEAQGARSAEVSP